MRIPRETNASEVGQHIASKCHDGAILAFLNAFKSFLASYSGECRTGHGSVSVLCKDAGGKGMNVLTLGKTLESSQRLTSVPLLDTDVDVILLRPYVFGGAKGVSFVCEGIYMRMKTTC